MEKKTYSGSCHCRSIRFEVDLDLEHGKTARCNCTVCSKLAYWGTLAKPADFRLLAGEDQLGDYSKSELGHARFCKRCGVRTHGHGVIEQLGGAYVSINVRTLDGVDLSGVQVDYLDGLNNTWALIRSGKHVSEFAES